MAEKRKRSLRCCGCVLLGLLLTVGGFFMFTGLGKTLWEIIGIYRQPAREFKPESCLSNFKNIAQSLQQYLASNEAYPPSVRWMDELDATMPIGNDVTKENRAKVFQCPAVDDGKLGEDGKPLNYGYAMNDALSSKWADEIKTPESVVFIFDSSLLARNAHIKYDETQLPFPARHGKVNNVLFANGSAKSIETKPKK